MCVRHICSHCYEYYRYIECRWTVGSTVSRHPSPFWVRAHRPHRRMCHRWWRSTLFWRCGQGRRLSGTGSLLRTCWRRWSSVVAPLGTPAPESMSAPKSRCTILALIKEEEKHWSVNWTLLWHTNWTTWTRLALLCLYWYARVKHI